MQISTFTLDAKGKEPLGRLIAFAVIKAPAVACTPTSNKQKHRQALCEGEEKSERRLFSENDKEVHPTTQTFLIFF